MSIKIRQNSTKNVIDVIFGTSSSAKKNVNKVVDWNGKVIWERVTTRDITGNLSYSTEPSGKDFYDWSYDETEYTYTDKFLTIYNVKYTGTSPATAMTAGTDYEVTYTGDTSGTIYHSGYGSVSKNAVAHIKGIGKYTGQVDVPYTITHENRKYVPTHYYFSFTIGSGCTLNSTTAEYTGITTLYRSESSSVTATVSCSDSTKYVSMNGGDGYDSPHTFTCYNSGSKGDTASFSFSATPKVRVSSVTFYQLAGAYKSTKYAGTTVSAYSHSKIRVALSDGNTIDFTGSGTSGGVTVTVTQGSAHSANPFKLNGSGSDVNLYYYTATATGDGSTVGGSKNETALCV